MGVFPLSGTCCEYHNWCYGETACLAAASKTSDEYCPALSKDPGGMQLLHSVIELQHFLSWEMHNMTHLRTRPASGWGSKSLQASWLMVWSQLSLDWLTSVGMFLRTPGREMLNICHRPCLYMSSLQPLWLPNFPLWGNRQMWTFGHCMGLQWVVAMVTVLIFSLKTLHPALRKKKWDLAGLQRAHWNWPHQMKSGRIKKFKLRKGINENTLSEWFYGLPPLM